jgi:hypothetical protein
MTLEAQLERKDWIIKMMLRQFTRLTIEIGKELGHDPQKVYQLTEIIAKYKQESLAKMKALTGDPEP